MERARALGIPPGPVYAELKQGRTSTLEDGRVINGASLWVNLLLAPAVWAGALVGRWLVHRINQRWFEILTLGLTAVAGLRLLLS